MDGIDVFSGDVDDLVAINLAVRVEAYSSTISPAWHNSKVNENSMFCLDGLCMRLVLCAMVVDARQQRSVGMKMNVVCSRWTR